MTAGRKWSWRSCYAFSFSIRIKISIMHRWIRYEILWRAPLQTEQVPKDVYVVQKQKFEGSRSQFSKSATKWCQNQQENWVVKILFSLQWMITNDKCFCSYFYWKISMCKRPIRVQTDTLWTSTFTNDKFVCSSFSKSQKFTDESRLAYQQ